MRVSLDDCGQFDNVLHIYASTSECSVGKSVVTKKNVGILCMKKSFRRDLLVYAISLCLHVNTRTYFFILATARKYPGIFQDGCHTPTSCLPCFTLVENEWRMVR